MNRAELRHWSRIRLDDSIEEFQWSDKELNEYIKQSVQEAQIRSRSVTDSTTDICTLIRVRAGQSFYPIHPAVFFIDRVYDLGQSKRLLKFGIDEADWCRGQWQNKVGKPLYYSDEMNHFGDDDRRKRGITLTPTPDVDTQLRLTVFRTQLCGMGSDDEEPELPSHQHMDLVHWVAHLAYQKPDSDMVNIEKSLKYAALFEEAFGAKQSARLLEYRRKHRPLRTVGQYL